MMPAERLSRQAGLMLLALLIAMSVAALLSFKAFEVWSTLVAREKESELLYVGDQYVQAIQRYYFASPSPAARELPGSLEQLIEDDRFPLPLRHLRELYADPAQPGTGWDLVRIGTKIVGVHSRSEQAPLKKAGFEPPYEGFSTARSLRDWQFVFRPPAMPWTGSQLPHTEIETGLGGNAAPRPQPHKSGGK